MKCNGLNCEWTGGEDGADHSLECIATHMAAIAGGRFVKLSSGGEASERDLELLLKRHAVDWDEWDDGTLRKVNFGDYGFRNFASAALATDAARPAVVFGLRKQQVNEIMHFLEQSRKASSAEYIDMLDVFRDWVNSLLHEAPSTSTDADRSIRAKAIREVGNFLESVGVDGVLETLRMEYGPDFGGIKSFLDDASTDAAKGEAKPEPTAYVLSTDLDVFNTYDGQCQVVLYKKPRKGRVPFYLAAPEVTADDAIARLIARHAEELEQNEYAYFELAYTRRTEWMAWICSNHRDDDPNRKVIARGQGSTPQEACAAAVDAALAAAAQESGNA